MTYTEAQRKANKAYYERNKQIICLNEKVKYWDTAEDRENMKVKSKREYLIAVIKKYQDQLDLLPPPLPPKAPRPSPPQKEDIGEIVEIYSAKVKAIS